jgi:hypothetical protein
MKINFPKISIIYPEELTPVITLLVIPSAKITIRRYLKNQMDQLLIKYGFVSFSAFIVVLSPWPG